MTLKQLAYKAEKLVTDNSPLLLTVIGVTGTVTTAVLTGQATFKAAELIQKEKDVRVWSSAPIDSQDFKGAELTPRETFELVWRLYIPAAGVGVMTITCIVLANRIGNRRAAAIAAAYSVSEKAFEEYREKIIEKIGANKEREARDDLAQDRVNRNPVGKTEVIITGGGEVLCYDTYTARYFMSDMETLKKAQNDVNYQVINQFYASLSDFYNKIGLPSTKTSDDVGWNSDQLMEIEFSTTMSDDDRPCIAIDFRVDPVRNYFRVH